MSTRTDVTRGKVRRTLLAVFAHPDDEAFGVGGTLARYASEGCDVYLVSATRGEAGEISIPSLATKANLAYVREQELRCACQAYGIHPPIFLDYVDGQMTIVNQGQAVAKLVRIIRELRPQVLITFGPEGIYGHYDHIVAHRWATIAAELSADAACFPEQVAGTCQPHAIDKLYFSVLSEEAAAALGENGKPMAVMMDGVPFYMASYKPGQITTVIDISAHVEAKLRAVHCHATQTGAGRFADDLEMMQNPLFCRETFILSRSSVGWAEDAETDLFARL